MFKLEPNPTFFAPVTIHVPGQGKGQIDVEFRFMDRDERAAWYSALDGKTNLQALSEIVVGWREIDEPFSEDNLKRLLNKYDTAASGFYEGFAKEISGAAEKN